MLTTRKAAIAVTFAVSLAVANITATKVAAFQLPVVGLVTVPAGFVGVAVAFLCSDLLSELYSREEARNVVNATVLGLLVAYGLIYLAVRMPAAPFYTGQAAYSSVLGGSATIVVASVLTALLSQNTDVTVFHWIDERVDVKAARNLGSTVVSQLVDTAVFIALAFVVLPQFLSGEPLAVTTAASLAVSQYLVKIGVAVADTPLFYLLTANHSTE